MGNIKEIEHIIKSLKNRTSYFSDDMINVKNFDSS